LSHKFFQMPYTHFFGYQHLTLRIQDNMQAWQWELADWRRYLNDNLTVNTIKKDDYKFKGKLVSRAVGGLNEKMVESHSHHKGGQTMVEDSFEGGE